MNRSMKAALLSGLVFPGAGHFYLKRHIAGTALAGTALASLFFLVSTVIDRALHIAGEIQRGGGPVDVAAISELLATQPADADPLLPDIATVVLLGAWLIGIVDSYRLGRAGHIEAGSGDR